MVQYWHTPFGDLQSPGNHGYLDPVRIHHDGSLLISNASYLHSGMYYCLLQGREETALWPYQLHIDQTDPIMQSGLKTTSHRAERSLRVGDRDRSSQVTRQDGGSGVLRLRRDAGGVVGPEEERQAGVSDGQFAAAVAASVVLTFVLGFSAGALSRAHVLRWAQRLLKSDK